MTRPLVAGLLLVAMLSTGGAVTANAAVDVSPPPSEPGAGPAASASPATAADSTRPHPESSASAASLPIGFDPSTARRTAEPTVVISEFANGGPHNDADSFVELQNLGDEPVDLSRWNLYRCTEFGLRRNPGNMELELDGVVLEPGERFTIARIGARLVNGATPDATIGNPLSAAGFGLDLVDPDGRRVDAVAVYPTEPWPMQSECTVGANLPNTLNYARGESWQRVATTGDVRRDFVIAQATPTEPNVRRGDIHSASSGVRIDEVAPAGPDGSSDDFVELRNHGTSRVDLEGWRLFRCTATGRLTSGTLQFTAPEGTTLEPGARFVIGGPGFAGEVDAVTSTSLADTGFGVLLEDARGRLVDRVAVSEYADSACQDGDAKLPSTLDFPSGESWQRVARTGELERDFVIAPRTPGAANARVENSVYREPFAYPAQPSVAISELATDPSTDGMPGGTVQRNFVELANYGDAPVDVSRWSVRRCETDGRRHAEPQFTVPPGTMLEPGETLLAAREGTPLAERADLTYSESFSFLGTGVWVADASGTRVDSVGVYQANEMDRLNDAVSPCSKGLSLVTYEPDRLREETYQRAAFTGVDAGDFRVAPATPGEIDRLEALDRTAADASALRTVRLDSAEPRIDGRESTAALAAWRADPVRTLERPFGALLEAFAGSSDGPLVAYAGDDERRIGPSALAEPIADDGFAHPYQRLVLEASALDAGDTVHWSGTTVGRNELQLSVWHAGEQRWRLADAATDESGLGVRLQATLEAADLDGGRVTLLVQNGPRTESALDPNPDGAFAAPADYDFAISHLTDTQYLSEAYPEVYTDLVSWIVANRDARKIAFATHTGDLVQNWVDPDQNRDRAEVEFERASRIQSILDDAGVPNSVLPGNHDSKRGMDPSLFNEWFGPERYADEPWYGGSIAPGDNSANFSTFEHEGARFLMLSLPYAYSEREIAWAEGVVARHPLHNVVVSTHEHLTPKTRFEPAHRSNTSRWVSRADVLWERVVAPNRNVVAVLSGHFHGIGTVVTEDAGGIPGHDVVELLADYQEFRTHTGERATGFQRLLQVDLASGTIAVDTFSSHLDSATSPEYDYEQFQPDNGMTESPSNARPWRILEKGLQNRYTAADDEFHAAVGFQYPKSVATAGLAVSEPRAGDAAGR